MILQRPQRPPMILQRPQAYSVLRRSPVSSDDPTAPTVSSDDPTAPTASSVKTALFPALPEKQSNDSVTIYNHLSDVNYIHVYITDDRWATFLFEGNMIKTWQTLVH